MTTGSTQIIIKDNTNSIRDSEIMTEITEGSVIGSGIGWVWRDKYSFNRETDEHEQNL